MAQRRMFSKKITDTDKFLDMPLSSQALYFHLNMEGDDDGFVGNARTIRRKIGASEDDLRILITKQFLIPFESGVIVIKDWRIHNTLRNDRYQPTVYQAEKEILDGNQLATTGIPSGNQLEPQHNLTEHNLTEHNKNTMSDKSDDVKEIINYLNEKASTNYRPSSAKTKSLIGARYKEGYTLDDFKKVIDNKVAEWLTNKDMCKFLRPETLFGPKFEGYLNQNNVGSKTNNQDTSQYDGMF